MEKRQKHGSKALFGGVSLYKHLSTVRSLHSLPLTFATRRDRLLACVAGGFPLAFRPGWPGGMRWAEP